MLYRFPIKDCLVLEIENASAEELARLLLKEVEEKLGEARLKLHSFYYFFHDFLLIFLKEIKKMKLSVYESNWSLATFQKKYKF